MRYLLDTGILLRMVHRFDAHHQQTRDAVRLLRQRGHSLLTTMQNIAEFWNVCTRPASARGGLGLTITMAAHRLRILERAFPVLVETEDSYSAWKRLLVANSVSGVQVHDARLVAIMLTRGITHVLTFNDADFNRYSGIQVVTLDTASKLS
jgi:predicted nucleic acid-binding protein